MISLQRKIVPCIFINALCSSVYAQSGCPSSNVSDVLDNQVVQLALDTIWRASEEGTPREHEEGFLVYQCKTIGVSGQHDYKTEIDYGSGTTNSLILPVTRSNPECRLVAHVHTHPGVAPDNPLSNDPYKNHQPSKADRNAYSGQVPGIIRYGIGADPDHSSITDIVYGPDSNKTLRWSCSELDSYLGTWTGIVNQPNYGTYLTQMNIREDENGLLTGRIEYPPLSCGGVLSNFRQEDNSVLFLETLTEVNNCIDGGTIRLKVNSDDNMNWEWFYPETGSLGAFGTLTR